MRYKHRAHLYDYNAYMRRLEKNRRQKERAIACNDPGEEMCGEEGFTRNQTWGGLIKARFALFLNQRVFLHEENSRYYAGAIQKLQHELGEKMSAFPELNMSIAGFFADHAEYLHGEYNGDEMEEMMNKDMYIFNKMREQGTTTLDNESQEGQRQYQEYEDTPEYERKPEYE
jgi:hypothetical protein